MNAVLETPNRASGNDGHDGERHDAEAIREHVRNAYIEPARQRHESTVQVVVGDVVRGMHLRNRTPAVCQALGGKKFLIENDLTLIKREGPPSGLGTTVTFVYGLGEAKSSESRFAGLLSLRGIGKETFAELGGGEAFLHRLREEGESDAPDSALAPQD